MTLSDIFTKIFKTCTVHSWVFVHRCYWSITIVQWLLTLYKKTFGIWYWHQFKMYKFGFTLQNLMTNRSVILYFITTWSKQETKLTKTLYFISSLYSSFPPFCGEIASPFSLAMSCTGGNLWFFHSFFFSFFLSLSLSLWSEESRKWEIPFEKCRYKLRNISTCIFSTSGPNKYWGLRHTELCNISFNHSVTLLLIQSFVLDIF